MDKKIKEALTKARKLMGDASNILDGIIADSKSEKVEESSSPVPRQTSVETSQFSKLELMDRDSLIEYAHNNGIPISLGKGSNTSKILSDIKEYLRVMNGNIPDPSPKKSDEDSDEDEGLMKKLKAYHHMTGCEFQCAADKTLKDCPYGSEPQLPCQEIIVSLKKKGE